MRWVVLALAILSSSLFISWAQPMADFTDTAIKISPEQCSDPSNLPKSTMSPIEIDDAVNLTEVKVKAGLPVTEEFAIGWGEVADFNLEPTSLLMCKNSFAYFRIHSSDRDYTFEIELPQGLVFVEGTSPEDFTVIGDGITISVPRGESKDLTLWARNIEEGDYWVPLDFTIPVVVPVGDQNTTVLLKERVLYRIQVLDCSKIDIAFIGIRGRREANLGKQNFIELALPNATVIIENRLNVPMSIISHERANVSGWITLSPSERVALELAPEDITQYHGIEVWVEGACDTLYLPIKWIETQEEQTTPLVNFTATATLVEPITQEVETETNTVTQVTTVVQKGEDWLLPSAIVAAAIIIAAMIVVFSRSGRGYRAS